MSTNDNGPVLDLQQWRGSNDVRVLAGRDRGEVVRQTAEVAKLDETPAPVEVRVPTDLFAVSSSFFLGLFADSIRRLGEAGFRAHYRFTGKRIDRVREDGIRMALLEASALG